jgi:pimeloyl-ACP methyl ester carboxylesterase
MSSLAVLLTSILATADFKPVDAEGRDFQYPLPVAEHHFESQRQKLVMAYIDARPPEGVRANGHTVVLLHGKNFNAAYWAPTVDALTAAGFRVVAPDQIGFGKSSKPERYQFSFAQLAVNTRTLLQALGIDNVAVVGHSMGGMLATRFALMFPDLVERLVLVNPIGLEDYAAKSTAVACTTIDDWFERERAQTPEKIRAYEEKSYFGGAWKPAYDDLMRMQAGFTLHPSYPRVAWDSALLYDMIVRQPVVHDFGRVRAPTLFIVGARDRTAVGKDLASPAEAAKMGDVATLARAAARRIRGARLALIPGVGHLPQVEAWERYLGALLGFLRPR